MLFAVVGFFCLLNLTSVQLAMHSLQLETHLPAPRKPPCLCLGLGQGINKVGGHHYQEQEISLGIVAPVVTRSY